MARRPRPNALLARPPEGVHGLGVAGGEFFRRQVGRPVRPEDYHGVHTTGSQEIAGTYAMGAWDTAKQFDPNAYPVILTLNVSGLGAVPDVDAIAQAAVMLEDRAIRAQFEGIDLDEARETWELDYEGIYTGADVNGSVMEVEQYGQGPMAAFDDEEDWERWVETGEYTDEEASRLVDQRRYLADFDLDRVVKVQAMKPWWKELVDEPYDETSEAKIEAVEAAGYRPVAVEDLGMTNILDLQTIAEGGAQKGDDQYHGTSSWHLARAFPELELPPNPFPVEHYDDVDLQALKGKLLR